MNIIALSVSRKVQLIKKLKNICKESSRKLFCADSSKDSPALYFGDDFIILPKNNSKNFLSFIIEFCKSKNITFILPTSDHDLVYLVTVREILLKEGISVLMSDSLTIMNCISKFKFADICKKNDISIPQIYSSKYNIKFPCIARLDRSQSSRGTFLIRTKDELNQLLQKYDFSELLFQKYIDSQEYTIDSFYGKDGKLVSAVPRKRIKVVDGESIISETVYIPELINIADKLSLVFSFFGHITIQAFFNNSQLNIIEVNPRFGGASNLSFNAGLKSPEWMLHLINKNYKLIYPENIKYNLKMLRYSQDYIL